MDQRLLAALENLGLALEEIAEALKSKEEARSASAKAVQAGNFGKQLENINIQLKSIKADTQEILRQQKTIQSMSKEKDIKKETPMEEIGKDKKKESALKKGIGTILLIAVAVLAIGMAFKLVGKIDFLSVIALGMAMWLISLSFEKIASLKLSLKESMVASLTMITMAAAITMSSWILSKITPVGILKLLTAIAIAGVFAVIGMSLDKLAKGISTFDKILGNKSAFVTPLVMIAISAGITGSSWIMSNIKPIGILQALTAIAIAGVFAVIGISLQKIGKAIDFIDKKIGAKRAAILFPIVLIAISAAITASSWIMSGISPIGLMQALTAIAISIVFVIIGFSMVNIAKAIDLIDKKIGAKKAAILFPLILIAIATAITISSWILSEVSPIGLMQFLTALGIALLFGVMSFFFTPIAIGVKIIDKALGKGAAFLVPLVFVAMSLAIMLSSHILSKTADIELNKILQIAVFGVALGIMVLAMLPSVLAVGIAATSGVGAGAIALGVLMIPLIAGAIAVSSHIIAMGKYDKYPGLSWILSVGASMTGFGLAVLALGSIAVTGIGLVAILAGALLVPVIAQTIVETDKIISQGKYDKYPGWKWILSVGSTMTGFGLAVAALGLLAVTGIGLVAILAGSLLVPVIAQTIVETDKVISKGNYSKYPGMDWAISVGGLMTVFGLAVVTLGSFIVGTLGLGYLALKAGQSAVKIIAQSIVDVAWIFNKNSAAFKKGPSKDWAEGVSIAIGAFAPVYSMLSKGGIMQLFTGTGPNSKQFADAIRVISRGIVDAALFFAGSKIAFSGGPKKEWSEGVGKAIGAFAPVYKILASEKGWFGTGVSVEKFAKAIKTISKGIVTAANIFSKNKAPFANYPSEKWGRGVGVAIGAFAPIFKQLSGTWFESGEETIKNMVYGIEKISESIVSVSKIFNKVKNWGSGPSKNWSWNVKRAILSYSSLSEKLLFVPNFLLNQPIVVAEKIVRLSKILSKGKWDFKIDPFFMRKVGQNILDFNFIVQKLQEAEDKKSLLKKLGDSTDSLFGKDPIVQIASRMTILAKAYDALATSLIKLGGAMRLLNIRDARMLGGITRGIVEGRSVRESSSSQPTVQGVRGGMATFREGKKQKFEREVMSQKDEKLLKKMDEVIKVLKNIDRSVASVDEYISDQTDGKYPSSSKNLF